MTTYLVRIVSGPAKGWEYVVLVPPDEVILIAPNRGGQTDIGGKKVHGEWMRVPFDGQPWLDERRYRRGPLPKTLGHVQIPDELLTTDGDIIVNYEVEGN